MAIFHFSVQVISRAAGRSAVAAAAYRAGERLHDERLDRDHDFRAKSGVVHSEILAPEGAPERLNDRATLWNEVEAGGKRKDAQLAREVEFSIPREMSEKQGVQLARDFVKKQMVDRGMVADLNVHWDKAKDGSPKPHAHVMLAMRDVGPEGFGKKNREWNAIEQLKGWREAWAAHVNERMAELGLEGRIDHRSYEAQGIELEPQHKIGPAASRRPGQGLEAERIEDHARIARDNGEKVIANPSIALDAITRQQATFTTRDLAVFAFRHSDGKEQFDRVMAAVKASPELVALGKDGRDQERFTSRDMIAVEARLERSAGELATRAEHGVADRHRDGAIGAVQGRGLVLSAEQRDAFDHITGSEGLASVVGYAGTGKSAMLGVAREAWERERYQVRGAALSGIADENLEGGSGIASRTIASLEHAWGQGREQLGPRDVLVVDEAGMIGSRQMERVFAHARDAGAKVVMVGDPEQLQAIEAGAAFRSITERHGAAEITEIRRQREEWQRDATRALATGRTGEAIHAYEARGMVHAADTRDQARAELVDGWDRQRQAEPGSSRIILTHTNDEVRELNEAARDRMRDAGQLGDDVLVKAERGSRAFATGDRIMFLRNERELEVKNGTLGTIEQVNQQSMTVRTDDGRSVAFDMKDYAHVDHGYAATIHKAQGMTVDRAHMLATPGMDRHGSYVGMSRHRDGVQLHYGRDDFKDESRLVRTLSRERVKDMASDYGRRDPARQFAERRGITFRERITEIVKAVPEKARGMFDGLRLAIGRQEREASPTPERSRSIFADFRPVAPVADLVRTAQAEREHVRQLAVQRHARAVADIWKMQDKGLPVLPHQRAELDKAREAMDQTGKHAAKDMEQAYSRDPALASDAAGGRVRQAIRAMQLEAEIRSDPDKRADRFVEGWRQLGQHREELQRDGDFRGARKVSEQMAGMAKSLERDAQVESLLRGRKQELGISFETGRQLSHDLSSSVGIEMGRGHDHGLSR
jgi:Ti-type conjugative transfer relaxase TraA